jgi:hypothetical protein
MSQGEVMVSSPGMSSMLAQLAPAVDRILKGFQPLLDQPVIRMPYSMPLAASQVIPAGARNVILQPTDFQYSFEYPFEVHQVKFSQDPAHTTRDWRVTVLDQTFNQPIQKSQTGSMIAQLVDDNTGKWEWKFPWIVRPKGGGLSVSVDNLDLVNPITVDISFLGYQLIPR